MRNTVICCYSFEFLNFFRSFRFCRVFFGFVVRDLLEGLDNGLLRKRMTKSEKKEKGII